MYLAEFRLKFIWFGNKGIAVALNQIYNDKSFPITEYFFWPRSDAWDEMRVCLKSKAWISSNEVIYVLNQLTEVVNFWQEKNNDLQSEIIVYVKEKFPDCDFIFL